MGRKGSIFTLLLEAFIVDWLKETGINAFSRGFERRTEFDTNHICVDEVSQRKGRKYLTIIFNHIGHILDVQDDQLKESLYSFYNKLESHATLNVVHNGRSKICFEESYIVKDLFLITIFSLPIKT